MCVEKDPSGLSNNSRNKSPASFSKTWKDLLCMLQVPSFYMVPQHLLLAVAGDGLWFEKLFCLS